jgi:hypothetical protein
MFDAWGGVARRFAGWRRGLDRRSSGWRICGGALCRLRAVGGIGGNNAHITFLSEYRSGRRCELWPLLQSRTTAPTAMNCAALIPGREGAQDRLRLFPDTAGARFGRGVRIRRGKRARSELHRTEGWSGSVARLGSDQGPTRGRHQRRAQCRRRKKRGALRAVHA